VSGVVPYGIFPGVLLVVLTTDFTSTALTNEDDSTSFVCHFGKSRCPERSLLFQGYSTLSVAPYWKSWSATKMQLRGIPISQMELRCICTILSAPKQRTTEGSSSTALSRLGHGEYIYRNELLHWLLGLHRQVLQSLQLTFLVSVHSLHELQDGTGS